MKYKYKEGKLKGVILEGFSRKQVKRMKR